MNLTIRSAALAGIVAVILQALLLATVWALPPHGPPEPTTEPYLRDRYFGFPGVRAVVTELNSANELTIGDYVTVHLASDAFHRGTVTTSLGNEILPSPQWVAPVSFDGATIGAAWITEHVTGTWILHGVMPESYGADLEGLQTGDRIMLNQRGSSWWIVRDDQVIPFESIAKGIFPTPVTLAEYQQYLLDLYGEMAGYPTPFFASGGNSIRPEPEDVVREQSEDYRPAADSSGVGYSTILVLALGLSAFGGMAYLAFRR